MGRAAAEMLRRLKSVDGYSEWWAPWSAEMASDPLMKYVYDARTPILHTGDERGPINAVSVEFRSFSMAQLPPGPPNTVGTFIGDPIGGAGWVVKLTDGSHEKVYFELPASGSVRIEVIYSDLPTMHLGERMDKPTIEIIVARYVAYIRRLIESAEQRFGKHGFEPPRSAFVR
jgi:hypothetical protein